MAKENEDVAISISDLDLEDGYDYLFVCEGEGVCDGSHGNVTRYTGTCTTQCVI